MKGLMLRSLSFAPRVSAKPLLVFRGAFEIAPSPRGELHLGRGSLFRGGRAQEGSGSFPAIGKGTTDRCRGEVEEAKDRFISSATREGEEIRWSFSEQELNCFSTEGFTLAAELNEEASLLER